MSLVKVVEIDCPWVEINKRQFNKYLEKWILPPDWKQFFQEIEQNWDSDSGIAKIDRKGCPKNE
ncbi:MAG: hypothetical protein KDI62_27900 [Anaerolineae bacterium]|nr:hypothetical protein [Anaerolineae bacterium]MCB9105847.1 hypothetical protein [Anaerolineales bacterium]